MIRIIGEIVIDGVKKIYLIKCQNKKIKMDIYNVKEKRR